MTNIKIISLPSLPPMIFKLNNKSEGRNVKKKKKTFQNITIKKLLKKSKHSSRFRIKLRQKVNIKKEFGILRYFKSR